jgi:hypothetical protein
MINVTAKSILSSFCFLFASGGSIAVIFYEKQDVVKVPVARGKGRHGLGFCFFENKKSPA